MSGALPYTITFQSHTWVLSVLWTSKATGNIPYTSLESPLGFQEVEAPKISRQLAHEGSVVVSCMHWLPLHSRKYSWYSFLLEAELTLGPECSQKDYVNKNSEDTIGNRTCDLLACSVLPQPTSPQCAPLLCTRPSIQMMPHYFVFSWPVTSLDVWFSQHQAVSPLVYFQCQRVKLFVLTILRMGLNHPLCVAVLFKDFWRKYNKLYGR